MLVVVRPVQPKNFAGTFSTLTQIMKRDGFIAVLLVAGIGYGATLAATAASKVDDAHSKCLKASDYVGCLSVQKVEKHQLVQTVAKAQPKPTVQVSGFGFYADWMETEDVGPEYDGFRIVRIFKDSPAEKAGLSVNDKLVSIGGIEAKGLTPRQISALLNDDMSDGEVGPLTFRNASTGLCNTFSLKKGTYTITKEEKMALRSDDRGQRAQIVIDSGLLESHKGARMLIKKQLASAS